MLRLDQLYFRNFSVLFFATLIVVALSGYFVLERLEVGNHKTMLTKMIDAYIVSEKFVKDPASLIKQLHDRTGVRITIIDRDGNVLYESNRPVKGMENHSNRPEIREALEKGIGSAMRHSDSVDRDFLYVAKKDGARFVRMAYALQSIQEKFFRFWLKAMLLFIAAMAVAFWLAMRINRRISEDLEGIETRLQNLLNKKYDIYFDNSACCLEFDKISRRVEEVGTKLRKRDRQKAKYTKNLKALTKKQSDIIAAVSHEFKNPIAAITGYAQTLKEDRELSEAIRTRFLDKVLSNAHKISVMIDRLALAIKLENENFTPEFTTFRLKPLLDDVRETLLQKYKDREIRIEAEDITLHADRGMFENLMLNLVENALKYSDEEVVVRVKEGRIEVIDRGIGIGKEDLQKIMKRFYRVDALTWDNSIGVGLYIVKYILKLHNSYLEIESEPGKGSTFWFSIEGLIAKSGRDESES